MSKDNIKSNKFQFADFNILKSFFNRIDNYKFNEDDLEFNLNGLYKKSEKIFLLNFSFLVKNKKESQSLDDLHILVESVGVFNVEFEDSDKISKDNLPQYFLLNAPAIMFPYIRSYITTLTANSNFGEPLVLPTLNISGLGQVLKDNIVIIE